MSIQAKKSESRIKMPMLLKTMEKDDCKVKTDSGVTNRDKFRSWRVHGCRDRVPQASYCVAFRTDRPRACQGPPPGGATDHPAHSAADSL